MPSDINHVNLIGRLTRDPELRALPSGSSVCEMGLAVNERYKNGQTGQWEDRANFFDVTVFGGQAEACAKYLTKGRPIGVDGRLRWESWEKDGQKRSKVKVIANTIQFLGSPKDSGADQTPASGYSEYESDMPADPVELPATSAADDDDDIPFAFDVFPLEFDLFHGTTRR